MIDSSFSVLRRRDSPNKTNKMPHVVLKKGFITTKANIPQGKKTIFRETQTLRQNIQYFSALMTSSFLKNQNSFSRRIYYDNKKSPDFVRSNSEYRFVLNDMDEMYLASVSEKKSLGKYNITH